MKRVKKILFIFLGLVLALVVVAAAAGVFVVRRPFPKTNGKISLDGLKDEVNIYRDDFGVPHIYAQNQDDLFFAQGYVHAQDRFWQMEFWRHTGQGRISEIVGEDTVGADKFIRTMGWNRMSANTVAYYEAEAPEFMVILDAYSAGVNAYINDHRDELSVSHTVLGLVNDPWEIEPWEPIDTISWGVVMSDVLSRDMFNEIRRAELIQELGAANVESLLPFYPYDNRPVIAPTKNLTSVLPEMNRKGGVETAVNWQNVNTNIIGELPPPGATLGNGPFIGSNNWVVSGEHTDTGLPLLANDPHLELQMPAIWYEVALHAPGWNVTGFSFAGVPGVIIGHNDKISWGVTNSGNDVQDLFIEKINPNDPFQYEFMGEWQDMEVIQEVIKVNGGEDVVLDVRITHHGPIMNEVIGDGDKKDVLAVQWTAAEPSRVLQSVTLLNQAQNYEEFHEALRFWDVPAQNFVYADVDGNIAYQLPSLNPIRKNGEGLLPVPGWTGEYEWEGWIPYEEMPAVLNPESGYIVTANHAIVDAEYPYFLKHYWADGDRGQRITELIEAAIADGDTISADDFARIQFDSKSLMAESYVPLFAGLSSDDAQVQAALERLRGWDLQDRRDSVPAALFEVFYVQLKGAVLADEVGEDNVGRIGSSVFFHGLSSQPKAIWWDDVETPTEETREDILLEALGETISWFEANVGDDMNEWVWGSIHTTTLVSNPLGQSGVAPIESLVNRGPFPSDGSKTTVNAMGWSSDDPAAVNWHPSMRMIVDMSDFDASRAVLPTGQSGHPYHPHYDDMIQLWLDGEYHPMLFSRESVEMAAANHLILRPAKKK